MVRVVFEIVFGLLCLALRVFRVVRVVWAFGRVVSAMCFNNVVRSLNAGARLAQSVERKALNLVVVGSSPTVGVFSFCAIVFAIAGGKCHCDCRAGCGACFVHAWEPLVQHCRTLAPFHASRSLQLNAMPCQRETQPMPNNTHTIAKASGHEIGNSHCDTPFVKIAPREARTPDLEVNSLTL